MDYSNARKISHQENDYLGKPVPAKGATKPLWMIVEIAPARLDAFFGPDSIAKKERAILAVLEERIGHVRAELLANSPQAVQRNKTRAFLACRDNPDPNRAIPNFGQLARDAAEKFDTAKLIGLLLAADHAAVLRPIFARLASELQRKRSAIEADLISRASALGVTLPLDCPQLLAIGALIGTLIARSKITASGELPSEGFKTLGFSLH